MKSQALPPDLKNDVDRLIQFVQIRTRPDDMLKELERRFSSAPLPESFGQDLIDYWSVYSKSNAIGSDTPFSEWLDAMRRNPGGEEKIAVWRARRSLPWMVAALSSVDNGSEGIDDLITETEKVPPDSPAYLTVQFHLLRLTADKSKQLNIARRLLKRQSSDLTNQDANAIKAIALGNVRNAEEFVAFAPRTPTTKLFGKVPNIDADAATIINRRLPLDVLEQICTTKRLPSALRDELAIVIWTRAFLLKRWDITRRVAPHVKRLIPGTATLVDEMMSAKDAASRTAIGAILMARYPGMVGHVESQIIFTEKADELALPNMRPALRQESNRLNWWCSFPENAYWSMKGYGNGYVANEAAPFLTKKQKQLFGKESAKLTSIPNATDYLGHIVMSWAKQHPYDARLPPALHLLVRSSRGGCIGDDTSTLSVSAFRHMHKYFPKSEWTRKTRVHY